LLKDTNLEEANKKAEILREKIASNLIASIAITCSFGVTALNSQKTIQDIIQEADSMLYIAKKKGRNQVVSS
jgi:diguanylate cyclase (GGDEF)-like protein